MSMVVPFVVQSFAAIPRAASGESRYLKTFDLPFRAAQWAGPRPSRRHISRPRPQGARSSTHLKFPPPLAQSNALAPCRSRDARSNTRQPSLRYAARVSKSPSRAASRPGWAPIRLKPFEPGSSSASSLFCAKLIPRAGASLVSPALPALLRNATPLVSAACAILACHAAAASAAASSAAASSAAAASVSAAAAADPPISREAPGTWPILDARATAASRSTTCAASKCCLRPAPRLYRRPDSDGQSGHLTHPLAAALPDRRDSNTRWLRGGATPRGLSRSQLITQRSNPIATSPFLGSHQTVQARRISPTTIAFLCEGNGLKVQSSSSPLES
mmetsp:Transcript_2123/g.4553  ORF Transcript_2123/g.4553 Transcript_2123/m.4553 type:complete len:332 (-) Transcript_2123:491-1486(-)